MPGRTAVNLGRCIVAGHWVFNPFQVPQADGGTRWFLARSPIPFPSGTATIFPAEGDGWAAPTAEAFLDEALGWVKEHLDEVAPENK